MSTTLIDIIQERSNSSTKGITFMVTGEKEEFLSYKDLYSLALKVLAHLQAKELKSGQELVFQVEDNKTFVIIYWACILGGIVPVPLTIGQNDEHRLKLFKVWKVLNQPALICSLSLLEKIKTFANDNDYQNISIDISASHHDIDDLTYGDNDGIIHSADEDDLAFIQFSSGSTGNPKGVALTHKNLITNMRAISHGGAYRANDSTISWMPLTHDMGLIGFHLNPLMEEMNQYIIPTALFVRRPAIWLDKVSEHKITVLCSPNFGYKYIIKHCGDLTKYDWDLSSVRLLYNGAEPISVSLGEEFLKLMSAKHLKRESMCPVYGLAEASLAVSMSGLEDNIITSWVDRNHLHVNDKVQTLEQGNDAAVSFVNVGKAVENCLIKITDENSNELSEETIGHIQIAGENVTKGYYNNVEETQKTISENGWLNTGDLGFMKDECLFVTGRAKDIVFINGQNFYPHDIERVAEKVEGIELNKIAVIGSYSEQKHKEQVIAFVFHRGGLDKFIPVAKSVNQCINTYFGFDIAHIIPVKDIPRTTSGKLQRFKLKQRYDQGFFQPIIDEIEGLLKSEMVYESAEGENEKRLLNIWQDIFNIQHLGVTQNFYELGGNSLDATNLQMRVLKEFQVNMTLDVLYKNSTIRTLASALDELTPGEFSAIPTAVAQDSYTLSATQKRLYYAFEMDSESTAYNIPVAFSLSGQLDQNQLTQGLEQLAKRHETLRMVFGMSNDPFFNISDKATLDFKLETCFSEQVNQTLQRLVQPFDLNNGPLWRARLLNVEGQNSILFLDFHHIISDGLSVHHFIDELLDLYANQPLAEAISYKDYVCWTNEQETIDVETRSYWKEALSGELPILDLPLDFDRPVIFDSRGCKLEYELDTKTSSQLRYLAKQNDVTLHVLLFTVYSILLNKYTGQEDIVIGIPVSGRLHPDVQNAQGMFVNNLAVRNLLKVETSFNEVLKNTSDLMARALDHQQLPFDDLIELIGQAKDASRNPLFDTMFNYQNMGIPNNSNTDLRLTRHFFDPQTSKFDLSLEIFEEGSTLKYAFEYASALFKKETIDRVSTSFLQLIKQITDNPGIRVSEMSALSTEDHIRFIEKYNTQNKTFDFSQPVHQLFESQVKQTPDAIALEFENEAFTYRQLNDSADQLANNLIGLNIAPQSIIGLYVPRSPELIIAILGILKSGNAYLPIDTDWPDQKVYDVIEDSRSPLMLSSQRSSFKVNEGFSGQHCQVEDLLVDPKQASKTATLVSPSDIAYVIYTSGTTGKPKGVVITHKSLTNYSLWAAEQYIKDKKEAFALYTSISFDLTVTSIFPPLINGNKINIYHDNQAQTLIDKVIRDNKSDIIKLTPSHLKLLVQNQLLTERTRVKRFILGGEALETNLAHQVHELKSPAIEMFNEYGPTEATVGCMIHQYDSNDKQISVPIGIPAASTQTYVLDKYLQPVPYNVPGELYISGEGLAKEYLFQPDLTANKFINNPFVPGQKMYKSGDIVKRLPSGKLTYIGRQDRQVKVNGHRIELGEIEAQLAGFEGVRQVFVNTEISNERILICAYYTVAQDHDFTDSELRNYLSEKLPYYMIPARFNQVSHMPLTINGKVDKVALKDAVVEKISDNEVSDESDIEAMFIRVWEKVLKETGIDVNSNFYELGGDSIKAVQIATQLMEHGIAVKVKDILTYHTIAQISAKASIQKSTVECEQGEINGQFDPTPIQSWFLNQQLPNEAYYNQSVLLRLNKTLSIDKLSEAFAALVNHYDTLRVNLNSSERKLFYNSDHLSSEFDVDYYKVSEEQTIDDICNDIGASFNLEDALLIKAAIIEESSFEYLFITAHHLVIDGVSWRIILEDLINTYQSIEQGQTINFATKTLSFKGWSQKLNELATKEEVQTETDFWNQQQNTNFSILQDFETEDWSVKNLDKISIRLDSDYSIYLLKEAHQIYNTDVLILLNAALTSTLASLTGADEICIEQEGHGRHFEEVNLGKTVGWFTTLYPLVFQSHAAVDKLIKSVKEKLRSVPDNGLGYGVKRFITDKDTTKPDIAEVRLNYLGQFGDELNNDMFTFTTDSNRKDSAPDNGVSAKLDINVMCIDNRFHIDLAYNSQAFKRERMADLMESYKENIVNILSHIEQTKSIQLTPTDFEADLNEKELDLLFESL